MIRFYRCHGTETLRRVWDCNADGEKLFCVGLIGRVDELRGMDILFDDNVEGNEDKWLVITNPGIEDPETRDPETRIVITEFDDLEAAKAYARANL